jgi:hypothetical protein
MTQVLFFLSQSLVSGLSALVTIVFAIRVLENLTGTGVEQPRLPGTAYFMVVWWALMLPTRTYACAVSIKFIVAAFGAPLLVLAFGACVAAVYYTAVGIIIAVRRMRALIPSFSISFSFDGIRALADRVCPPREPDAPEDEREVETP